MADPFTDRYWWQQSKWFPSILTPGYTWPRPMRSTIATKTPPMPTVSGPVLRRIWGLVHKVLFRFAGPYCRLFGITRRYPIIELPFGLILKWSERVHIEEAVAMEMARAAGMPVPKVLCYGEHPGYDFRLSILMTRLPGFEMIPSEDGKFDSEIEQPWFDQLAMCVNTMRQWESPFGHEKVCSVVGTSIWSQRVPRHVMGPLDTTEDLGNYLLGPASLTRHWDGSTEEYEEKMTRAKLLFNKPHRTCFTHGDFKQHNILVNPDDFSLSGFIDWESAGWCPEYWEFTTAMRFGIDTWWYQGCATLSNNKYAEELESDRALNNLTVDSYIAW